jgi:uncharacterized membrane protein YccF (DUF307 family)
MRAVRGFCALLLWILATVLLLLAAVLSITIVLLPVGVPLGFAALRLYRLGLRLALPRGRDVRKGVRKEARRWRKKSPVRELDRSMESAGRRAWKAVRKISRAR